MTFKTIVSPQELAKNLSNPDWVIVDCSYDLKDKEIGRVQYLESHIAGAVFAHVYQDLSGPPLTDKGRHPLPSAEQLETVFGRLGITNQTGQVIAYDRSNGQYAARLWWSLNYMGYTHVAVLDGGWHRWQAAGYPTTAGEESNSPVRFQGEPNREMLVTLEAVLDQKLLIDSRDAERYAGRAKGSDPVAGHIPGALHRHYPVNLDSNKEMRDPAELKAEFGTLFGDTPPEEVTFYCGSGVSACVNLLAMKHAGLPLGKLYVGSWSEWSRYSVTSDQ